MSQLEALKATVEALGSRLTPETQALVAAAEGLAQAVDDYPHRATLWKEYREVLDTLRAVAGEGVDDGEARLRLLVSTPVGQQTDTGPADVGAGGRGDLPGARPAADALAETGS